MCQTQSGPAKASLILIQPQLDGQPVLLGIWAGV